MDEASSPSSSGNILQSASNVVITGGSFTTTVTGSKDEERLQTVYNLAAPNAILNAGGRADAVKCFPGTREEVLAKIESWISVGARQTMGERRIFWLSGPAGAGKSAIVQTLAERCIEQGVQMINFFFFRGDNTRNHIRPVLPTLLCQLFESHPESKPLIAKVLKEKPLILDKPLHDQFTYLIHNTIGSASAISAHQQPIVLLVDGLDECDLGGKQIQQQLLLVLHRLILYRNSPFLVLVASRPEPHLTMTFNEIGTCPGSIFLDENYRPEDDIRRFVVAELTRIKNTHHLRRTLDNGWPPESSVNAIVKKSSGQFIYAATVMRSIANSSASPAHSLEKVLGVRPITTSSPFAELDAIYTYVLSQAEEWEPTKDILSAQIFLSRLPSTPSRLRDQLPYTLELYMLLRPLGYKQGDSASYTADLTAIMRQTEKVDTLEFYHASLTDFLCDESRSGKYYVDMGAFADRLIPTHLKKISDYESMILGAYLLDECVSAATPPINEVLQSCPPHFEWPHRNVELDPIAFVYTLNRLYFYSNIPLYKLLLRNWLTWFRDMKVDIPVYLLENVELANEIWVEVTMPKTQSRRKMLSRWRRLFRVI